MTHASSHSLPTQSIWASLYKLGAVAALLPVLAFTLDIAISFGGEDFNPAALTAIEWFGLFQENGIAGLRALGLINLISLTVSVPLYLAICAAIRHRLLPFAVLALAVYLLGAAIYISNNAAIPMYVLSGKFALATSDLQRSILAGAGEAVLARGADFAPGCFVGFFLTELAGIGFSVMMLRNQDFGKATAFAGILGFGLLSVFTVWATFLPVYFEVSMLVAAIGGLSSVLWHLLVSRNLFRLGRSHSLSAPILSTKSSQAG